MMNIVEIIKIEFEKKRFSNNQDLIPLLRSFIELNSDMFYRRLAISVLTNISKYYGIKETHSFLLDMLIKEKDKLFIRDTLNCLSNLEYESDPTEKLMPYLNTKNIEIKWAALNAISTIKNNNIENRLIELLRTEKNNLTIIYCIRGLATNGTNQSIEILIKIFNKTRDGQMRGECLETLRVITNKFTLSQTERKVIDKFIGNNLLYFHGIWMKGTKFLSSNEWEIEAKRQLTNNQLNIAYTFKKNILVTIHFEKMSKVFFGFTYLNPERLDEDYLPRELIFGTSKFYPNIVIKSSLTKLNVYLNNTMSEIKNIGLLEIEKSINALYKFKDSTFEEYKKDENEIWNQLIGTTKESIVLMYFIQLIFLKSRQIDFIKFIDYGLVLWDNYSEFSEYSDRNYLLKLKAKFK
jgi:hypothetical protein